MAPGLSSAYWRHVEAFLALPEAEQRAARRRLLAVQQQEDEGRAQERRNATTATAASASASAVSNGEGDPRLLLLVPARSVDWGGSEGSGQQHQQPQYGGAAEAWLEVGCRLTSMRLVNDVRFPPAGASV